MNNSELKRAVKRDSVLTWKNRNFLIATTEIKRIGHVLNLPSYVKEAILKLYKKAYIKNLLKGRSILGMVAACIYYICKEKEIPRNFLDIVEESPANPELIKNCYKILVKKLNLKVPIIDPISFIPKYCSDLSLDKDIENLAIKILKMNNQKSALGGVDPKGLCGGALYLAAKMRNKKLNQTKIVKVVNISEVTLRSRYKELLSNIEMG